eukprot:36604_1
MKKKSKDPLKCPIYYATKQQYQFDKQHLNHLNEFNHFLNEYEEKPSCKYSDDCNAYKRMENGGNRMDDKCHMKIYRHPPRRRNIKLAENVSAFIYNTDWHQNCKVYCPNIKDHHKYNCNDANGYLSALIEEVVVNGFKTDLCLQCGTHDECKHEDYSILEIVDQKMQHIRHIQMGRKLNRAQMLALVLYSGCECNYDLCSSQRNGDYKRWKWFDVCLYDAIKRLSWNEIGSFSVFSGLKGVKIDNNVVKNSYFVTYTSTSWRKDVATSFMGGNTGMIFQIDKEYKTKSKVYCCDISWISKFPDEFEVLFARSSNEGPFQCIVLDESNGVQTVSLKRNDSVWE